MVLPNGLALTMRQIISKWSWWSMIIRMGWHKICLKPIPIWCLWPSLVWHDDVIKWKHIPRYWPFVRGIHRSPVNSPHKGQWCGALVFSLICARINRWENNREAGDLRRHGAHYDVIVMIFAIHSDLSNNQWQIFVWNNPDLSHIEAQTKLPRIFRRHFQMHFLELEYMNFNKCFTELCS